MQASAILTEELCQLVETPLEEDFHEEYLQLLAALVPQYYPTAAHLAICATLIVHPTTRQTVLEDGTLVAIPEKEALLVKPARKARGKGKPGDGLADTAGNASDLPVGRPYRRTAQLAQRALRILQRTLERHGPTPFAAALGFSAVEVLQAAGTRRKARKAAGPRDAGRYNEKALLVQGGFVLDQASLPHAAQKRDRSMMEGGAASLMDIQSDEELDAEGNSRTIDADLQTEFVLATSESVFNQFDSFWALLRCSFCVAAPEMATRWLGLCDVLISVLEQDFGQRQRAADGMASLGVHGTLDAATELDCSFIAEFIRSGEDGHPSKIAKAILIDFRCPSEAWPQDPWQPSQVETTTKRGTSGSRTGRGRRAKAASAVACGLAREDACFSELIEQSGAEATFDRPDSDTESDKKEDDGHDQVQDPDLDNLLSPSKPKVKAKTKPASEPESSQGTAAHSEQDSAALWGHTASLPLRIRLFHLIADAATALSAASGQRTSFGRKVSKLLHFNAYDWLHAVAQEMTSLSLGGTATGPKHIGQLTAFFAAFNDHAQSQSEEARKIVLLQRGERLTALMLAHCSVLAQQTRPDEKLHAPKLQNLFKEGVYTSAERTACLMAAKPQNTFSGPRIGDYHAVGRIALFKTHLLLFAALLNQAVQFGSLPKDTDEAAGLLTLTVDQMAEYKEQLVKEIQQDVKEELKTRIGRSTLKLTALSAYKRREFRIVAQQCLDGLAGL